MIEIIIVNIQLTSLQNECFQELVKHDLKILRASRPPAARQPPASHQRRFSVPRSRPAAFITIFLP